MTLGGIVCVRNANRLDYCWRESIQSLLPVCDMVSVSVAESDDGTEEQVREWASREPKIVVNIYPWQNPVGVPTFWVDWLQYARQHTPTDFVIQLDADEVLASDSHQAVKTFVGVALQKNLRISARCLRYNFWKDAWHLIPEGVCLAHEVIRIMPQNIFLPSDGADPRGSEATDMAVNTPIEIFHYGFLRKRESFFQKAKDLQKFFFNDYDKRLEEADKAGGNWMTHEGVVPWKDQLVDFKGSHPLVAQQWLKDRNWL